MGFLDWIFGNNEKKKRKREKKRREEAAMAFEEERQRRVKLEMQLKRVEEERQMLIEIKKQEEQRQLEEKQIRGTRQIISTVADSFIDKSLEWLTLKRVVNAEDDWEELCTIEEEARCARNIESNANVLPTSPYCEAIMQRLFDAYSTRDIEELQALMEESEQIQNVKSIESCSLSANLRQITDERVANGINMEELRKIEREALCASNIEQECIKLDKQGCVTYPIRKKLEDAYRNHNIQMLSKLMAEVKQLSEIYELIHSIKTYSLKLSDNLQKITDEKLNKAGHNIDELHRIEQEVCDIYGIERFF